MDIQKKRGFFLDYANRIKELGYRVFIFDDVHSCYGYVVNDKNQIGYFQSNPYGLGVEFSTLNVPNSINGTGYSCNRNGDYQTDITKEIVDRCFAVAPDWVVSASHVKKWDADKFLAQHWNRDKMFEL